MKIHIFVATTQGLVAIQNIIPIDDSGINSIVSLNGTSTTANISGAYHNFVKKGAGIIEQDFGLSSYRLNVSDRIDHGNSWQLAFYIAHAAYDQNMLGDGQVKSGDKVICATGEVNTSTRLIQAVEQVVLKQELALTSIEQWKKSGVNVLFLIPFANTESAKNTFPEINVERVVDLEQALSFLPQQEGKKSVVKSVESIAKNKLFTQAKILVLLLLVTMIAVLGFYLFNENTLSQPSDNFTPQKLTFSEIEKPTLVIGKLDVIVERKLLQANKYVVKALTEQFIAADFEITNNTIESDNNDQTDLLAINFRLEVNKEVEAGVERWRFDLFAELVDLSTNHKVETHSELGFFSDVAINCDRKCFSYFFAEKAKLLAQDMGALLVEKINRLPRRYQYEISFQSFLAEEFIELTRQLKSITGYTSIKSIEEINYKNEWFHQVSTRTYRYTSKLSGDELGHILYGQFQQLSFPVKQNEQYNNNFVFIRGAMPYKNLYILGTIFFVSFFFVLIFFYVKNKYTTLLDQLIQQGFTQQALSFYHNIMLPEFIKNSIWREQKYSSQNKVVLAVEHTKQALNLIEQAQWQYAEQALNKALAANADNVKAQALKSNFTNFQQGYRQYLSVKENEHANITYINKNLKEAIKLAPFLEDKISLLRQELINKHSQSVPLDIIKQTQSAIENKSYYKALSLIDGYLKFVVEDIDNNLLLEKLRILRSTVVKGIKPLKGNAQLTIGQQQYYIFSQNKVELSRSLGKGSDHFSIGYNGLSKAGQQTLFTRQHDGFYITEKALDDTIESVTDNITNNIVNSSNGNIYNLQRLVAGQATKITNNSTVIFAADMVAEAINVCQLNLRLTTQKSAALIMSLNKIVPTFYDNALLTKQWPSLYVDLKACWILMGSSVAFGVDENGCIDVGCINGSLPLAYLRYKEGFYLQPSDNKEVIQLKINQYVIYDTVPISSNATITINECEFTIDIYSSRC